MEFMTYSNLRFARENFKYTVRDLGSLVYMNPSTISKYENGKRGLPTELVRFLCEVLDCSFEFIMQESNFGLYAYYTDKKIALSIEQYNNLASNNLIEVINYKRIIKDNTSLDTLKPIIYSI